MTAPQNNPRVKIGLAGDRPPAAGIPQGDFYIASDTNVLSTRGPVDWIDTGGGINPANVVRSTTLVTADNPSIGPGVGFGSTQSTPFIPPANAVYGIPFQTGGTAIAPGAWPVVSGIHSTQTGDPVVVPTDSSLTIVWLDPSKNGVGQGNHRAEFAIVWFCTA